MCEGTKNIICDAAKQVDESYYPDGVVAKDEKRNGAIYNKGSVVFSGSGLLQITGKKKHGISVKSSVTFRPGVTVVINDVADNCIKAEGITILGGYTWAKTSAEAGKCLSSDADITISGGTLKLYTSGSATPEEGVDCDRSQNFIVSSGTIIGTGGAAVSTSTSSTQRSVIYNGVRAKTGELFVITDADGQPILKYELPRTMTSMAIFFSSPDIRQGATYTVYSGGSLSGNTINWNGWFEDGKYNKGTELGTFTSDNINTTVGQSSGLGGGPGNGDPGNGSPGNGGFGPGWWN